MTLMDLDLYIGVFLTMGHGRNEAFHQGIAR